MLIASNDGRFLALQTDNGVRVVTVPPFPSPTPAPMPPFSDPRRMMFDHLGMNLYVTSGAGLVGRLSLGSGAFDVIANLGGSLNGLDIAPDDSFLLLAQDATGVAQGAVPKLDLHTGAVTNLGYQRGLLEGGAWDVAIASNGTAFVTTRFYGSGFVPLHQIDLTTNTAIVREDAPGYPGLGGVSADKTSLAAEIEAF